MKTFHGAVTTLILLLGAVHTVMGFYCTELNEDTLWFIGSGVAILLAGLMNLLAVLSFTKPARVIVLLANLFLAGLFVIAVQVLPEPHVYAGLVMFILAGLVTFLRKAA